MTTLKFDPAEYARQHMAITIFIRGSKWPWFRLRLWIATQVIRLGCWVANLKEPEITPREEHLEQVMKDVAGVADSHIISCERGECRVCDTFMIIRDTLESNLPESDENESLH